MTNRLRSIALAACTVGLLPIEMTDAVAKQQCSTAIPSTAHGHWWSYRIIDGRKCWYEGKPMLAKSELEWPKEASLRPAPAANVAGMVAARSTNPLDSQAWATEDVDTFEARWLARIGNR
jgi:hypothetical protein